MTECPICKQALPGNEGVKIETQQFNLYEHMLKRHEKAQIAKQLIKQMFGADNAIF